MIGGQRSNAAVLGGNREVLARASTSARAAEGESE